MPPYLVYVVLETDTPNGLVLTKQAFHQLPRIPSPQVAFIQGLSHLMSILWRQIVWLFLGSCSRSEYGWGSNSFSQSTEVPAGGLGAGVCKNKEGRSSSELNCPSAAESHSSDCLTIHFNLGDGCLTSCFKLLDAVTVPSLEMNSQKSN